MDGERQIAYPDRDILRVCTIVVVTYIESQVSGGPESGH